MNYKYDIFLKSFQHPIFVIMIGSCQSLEYLMEKEYIGALIVIPKDYQCIHNMDILMTISAFITVHSCWCMMYPFSLVFCYIRFCK